MSTASRSARAIVDASIVSAPSSTKNKDGQRDREMRQVSKGKPWYFGMKAHIGVDSKEKIIHTVTASAANIADSLALPHLLLPAASNCKLIQPSLTPSPMGLCYKTRGRNPQILQRPP